MKTSLVLCDTNIIIHYLINEEKTIRILDKIGFNHVLISSITAMELTRGARNKHELSLMRKNISQVNIIHFNDDISKLSIDLISSFHLSHNLQIPDAITAATAIYYNLPLFTYNLKDFKFIEGLSLYKA